MSEHQKIQIEISSTAIVKVLAVLFFLWFLYVTRDIVLMLFVSLLLASILEPFVTWMRGRKIPAAASVLSVYLALVGILVFVGVTLVPPIVDQSTQLLSALGSYWDRAAAVPVVQDLAHRYNLTEGVQQALTFLRGSISNAGEGVVSKVTGFFGGLVSFIAVLVITFYLLSEESALKRIMRSIVPSQYQPYLYRLFGRIQEKLGRWIRGQLVLSAIIFCLVYLGLLLLGVPYALVLALIAGLLEFIPYLGPIISSGIAVLLTFPQSPIKALIVLVLYAVIQQVENHILVPKVMQRAIGLNPVISIIALLMGARLGGVVGVVLAIPVVTSLSVFITDFIDQERESANA